MAKKVVVKLSSLLAERDMSLNQLSDLTGVRRAALSEIANHKRERIQFEHIEKIAEALNIDDIREIITIMTIPDEE
ncbi:helix-turn-helix transcriptional regulator [Paenibacillus thiaminolyticus]|uniref:XRE family transcriptional regulator n=1 Tax=Paenibacillus thiaminolyticus TaxID=49283 RepID=A0A3A3H437_PANTH|nr:helix-turn-helix transcriptional regulator [Paenibacillus thiaminolyticus]RJG24066.1 XRE family transcriptional regulator [Paenibacillus thiaminolyticus]